MCGPEVFIMWWLVLLLAAPSCLAFYGAPLVPGPYVAASREIRFETLMTTCGGQIQVYQQTWVSCSTRIFTCGLNLYSGIDCGNCQCKAAVAGGFPYLEQWARGPGMRGCPNTACDMVCWPQGFVLDAQGCRTCACNKPGMCPPPHCRKKCGMGKVIKTYDEKGCPVCLCRKGMPEDMGTM